MATLRLAPQGGLFGEPLRSQARPQATAKPPATKPSGETFEARLARVEAELGLGTERQAGGAATPPATPPAAVDSAPRSHEEAVAAGRATFAAWTTGVLEARRAAARATWAHEDVA